MVYVLVKAWIRVYNRIYPYAFPVESLQIDHETEGRVVYLKWARPETSTDKSDNTPLNHALIVLLCCMLSAFFEKTKISSNILNGKENLEDYPPPAKKRRQSLSLRKKNTSPLQECAVNVSRFPDPVSQEEMEVAAQGVVPDNT